jgi:hypothetical protein
VGVITCDITGLGVVVTVDSQPTIIRERQVDVASAPLDRARLIDRVSPDFSGYVTFVGTEEIGGTQTGRFLARHSASHPDAPLADYLAMLADDLSQAWKRHGLDTGLYIHAQGASGGAPVFHIVNNIGGMEGLDYVDIGTGFRAVNEFDDNIIPQWERWPGEGKSAVLARTTGYLRNGSLVGYVDPFDDFNGLMSKLYDGRYDGFTRFSRIEAYAALVRMRAEFITRVFKPAKGLFTGQQPVHAPVEIRAVDLDGGRWRIPVKDGARRDK